MKKSMKNLCFAGILCLAGAPAFAADAAETDPGAKAGAAVSNIFLGWLEIPKQMVNTTNDSNVILGPIGGAIKGALHAGGRTLGGLADLVTAPLPVKPIVEPAYVWDSLEKENRYNELLQPEEHRRDVSREWRTYESR